MRCLKLEASAVIFAHYNYLRHFLSTVKSTIFIISAGLLFSATVPRSCLKQKVLIAVEINA